jgi:hypothetical protein
MAEERVHRRLHKADREHFAAGYRKAALAEY